MSIEIFYGRQWIKTSEGLIPLFLHGSSNCTMFHGGREILERNWSGAFFDTGEILLSVNEVKERMADLLDEKDGHLKCECRINGKYSHGKAVYDYIVNGAAHSITLEDIYALSGYPLNCYVGYRREVESDSEPGRRSTWGTALNESLRTEEELLSWIDRAKSKKAEILAEAGTEYAYLMMEFPTIKPLGIDRCANAKSKPKSKVLAKLGRDYVTEYTSNSVTCSSRPSEALVLSYPEETDMLPRMRRPYTFVDAEVQKRDMAKTWFVKTGVNGKYITKLGRHTIHSSGYKDSAKRFTTRAAAQRWVKDHDIDARFRISTVVVEET